MLVPLLIMLREGIEASLIVGIVATYLVKTGRHNWLFAVWAGVVLAVLLCAAVGLLLAIVNADFPQKQQELFEGAIGVVAVFMLTSMVLWMKEAARSMKAGLQVSIDAAFSGVAAHSGFALVGLVFFAVAREGLESMVFLLATFEQATGPWAAIGAGIGLIGAAIVGFAIYWGGIRINLSRFFRWTAVFILVVAAGLLAGSVRAFHEAGLWNELQQVVFDWSHVLPQDSPLGSLLAGILGYEDTPTVSEVSVYLAFLVIALPIFLFGSPLAFLRRRTAS
ncbi:MAG TPA: iron uptake transporter permease EfeU [Devosiaceae bacterium]|nr:iron uptake transporter permease EfeU [Devosiaceae bacterium]